MNYARRTAIKSAAALGAIPLLAPVDDVWETIAAGATITVVPTLIVYLALQRHFVAGLTLGASKG